VTKDDNTNKQDNTTMLWVNVIVFVVLVLILEHAVQGLHHKAPQLTSLDKLAAMISDLHGRMTGG